MGQQLDTNVLDIQDHHRFRLSSEFLSRYAGKQPAWGPMGHFTFKRTYARDVWYENHDLEIVPDVSPHILELAQMHGQAGPQATEEFWMAIARVTEGVYTYQHWHCDRLGLPWDHDKATKSAEEMFERMWAFKWLPPGRGLAKMGTRVVEKIGGAALNSCAFVSTKDIDLDFADPFCFLMDMAMLGVGVGSNTAGAKSYDTLGEGKVTIVDPKIGPAHVVEDTREGWVDLARRLLNAYVGKDTWPESIDYSKIRPKGSPIRTFGGKASGPDPLIQFVKNLESVLDPMVGRKISSDTIVRLANVAGVCIVSADLRRTAEIMLGDADDEAFLTIKDPTSLNKLMAERDAFAVEGGDTTRLDEIIANHPLRRYLWASNNSVYANVGMDYTKVADQMATNGEPGLVWLETARAFGRLKDPPDNRDYRAEGCNPCSEQTLENYELCCLVETFPSNAVDIEDFKRTLKFAYLYAKVVTLIPTHNKRTNAVMLRNRRIGTSQSGIVQAMNKFGTRPYFEMCDEGYRYIDDLDKIYSEWLCVPQSIKKTSVKPSGTVSLLPGVTPGIHDDHSEYYWRLATVSGDSPLVQAHIDAGYRVEDYVYSPGTKVIYFPIHAEHLTRGKLDVTIWEQLERAAQMQHYWADNQVSVTVTFRKDEAKDIAHALSLYDSRLKSVSFLPAEEGTWVQAPYQSITKEEYEAAVSQLKPVDYSTVGHEVDDLFCDGDKCVLPM